jgi:hypothetical protein
MQPAHRDDSPAGRASRERRVRLVPFPQPGEEIRDVLRAHVLYLGPPGRGQGRRVSLEVATVGLESVLGEAPFDGEVVEIAPDGSGEGGQLSTSTSGSAGRPCASATGAQVTLPSWVFRPRANDGSRRSASRQPRFAISTTYGRVTFVSA